MEMWIASCHIFEGFPHGHTFVVLILQYRIRSTGFLYKWCFHDRVLPVIEHNTSISAVCNKFLVLVVSVRVSMIHVIIGLTLVLFILILLSMLIYLLFHAAILRQPDITIALLNWPTLILLFPLVAPRIFKWLNLL